MVGVVVVGVELFDFDWMCVEWFDVVGDVVENEVKVVFCCFVGVGLCMV